MVLVQQKFADLDLCVCRRGASAYVMGGKYKADAVHSIAIPIFSRRKQTILKYSSLDTT